MVERFFETLPVALNSEREFWRDIRQYECPLPFIFSRKRTVHFPSVDGPKDASSFWR